MSLFEIATRKGAVAVAAFGAETAPTFLALSGLAQRPPSEWETAGVAACLSATHRVLVPDPYSNARLAPSLAEFAVVLTCRTLGGAWRGECREEWLLDLLPKPTRARPVVLAGHSWGGGAVARLAAVHPEAVSRLVLVSPDVEWSVARRCWSIPTLLIWARDDLLNPRIWISRWAGHPRLTVHMTERGGHHVLEEHAGVISAWLNDQDRQDGSN